MTKRIGEKIMEEQFTSEKLQPIEQARKEDYAQKKRKAEVRRNKRD